MNEKELPKLLTIKQYCLLHEVSRQTVYRWIKAKKLVVIKIGDQQLIVA